MGITLSELTEWSLEVVVFHRHVVVVGGQCALHLVEPRLAVGICTAVIHIVAQEVGAAAQLHYRHRVGILGIEVRSAVIGSHHTASKFTGEVWILFVALVELFFLLS